VVPRSADARRHLRIAVVGAGVSGILAGIKLPQVLKENFELVIYDKNADVYASVDPLARRKLMSQRRNVV
jgi:cation diffusion facilitator CzcD-associated flavoprotein CzcO